MGKPSGRRTKHYTVYLSEAEAECLEAARAAEPVARSRADFLLRIIEPVLEEAAERGDTRSEKALKALEADEHEARAHGFGERGGRPPKLRPVAGKGV